jgi:Putative zinc-finger
MYYSGDLVAAARQADVLRNAREQARVHEVLLARSTLGDEGGLRFFARFVPSFGRRTQAAGDAFEASGSTCARARRWVSLSLDGELAHAEHALLVGHLERCASCSSFQDRAGASTAMLRGTPHEQPEHAFDLVRVTQTVNGMPAGSEGILVKGIVVSRYAFRADEVVVRFWDGGPMRVPGNALARIGRVPAEAAA